MSGGWRSLERELDAWASAGRTADLWWRDDDAAAPTPAFLRLLALRAQVGAPLAVAVVPALAGPALAEAVDGAPGVRFLQHGYGHANHAAPGERRSELPPRRPRELVLDDLRRGRELMAGMCRGLWLPDVMVPPWNRISEEACALLPRLGFRRLSVFGPRRPGGAAAGLAHVNTHVDIVDWRGGRGHVGDRAAAAALEAHLAARRTGGCDAGEATGVLTHHAVHDEGCWGFMARLGELVAAHPAARWRDVAEL